MWKEVAVVDLRSGILITPHTTPIKSAIISYKFQVRNIGPPEAMFFML